MAPAGGPTHGGTTQPCLGHPVFWLLAGGFVIPPMDRRGRGGPTGSSATLTNWRPLRRLCKQLAGLGFGSFLDCDDPGRIQRAAPASLFSLEEVACANARPTLHSRWWAGCRSGPLWAPGTTGRCTLAAGARLMGDMRPPQPDSPQPSAGAGTAAKPRSRIEWRVILRVGSGRRSPETASPPLETGRRIG